MVLEFIGKLSSFNYGIFYLSLEEIYRISRKVFMGMGKELRVFVIGVKNIIDGY